MSVTWSVHVLDAASHEVLIDQDGERVLPVASIGKVLLLAEVARRIVEGSLDPLLPLAREDRDAVGDSGLWQHLRTGSLPVADLAALVGAVSDNLATNVLLRHLGLESVQAGARRIGVGELSLHDRVRDHRGPLDPSTLATASASALARVFARLSRGELVSPETDRLVRSWLASNTDLSMVASAWALDPLAHRPADCPELLVMSKTGTDAGVRADAGTLETRGRSLAWAAIAHWEPGTTPTTTVLEAMRALGERLLSLAAEAP